MNDKRDAIEKEFLSILFFKPDIGFDLLQIKPQYLSNEINQSIFQAIKNSYESLGIVDTSYILDNLSDISLDKFTTIVADENMPITNIRKHFVSAQHSILENYKKKVIADLTNNLNNGFIDCNAYLQKMAKINDIQIQNDGNILTLEEINLNISTSKTRIKIKKFPKLDNLLQLVEGDFLVIGANTGVGKSSLLLNMMNSLMEDYQCIFFNMEMSKSTLYKRMLSIKSDVPFRYIDNPETEYQRNIVENAKQQIVECKVIIEHQLNSIEDIEKFIKVVKNEDGKHTIIFLDHIGLIRTQSSRSLYEQTTEVVKSLRQMCLKYDCTIISACQLNRASYGSEEINISMLKDSGEVENSASKIILLSRQKEYSSDCLEPEMILDICKNRDGMEGQITCVYQKVKQLFKEI